MKKYKKVILYCVLILIACTTIVPFIILISTSLKGPNENLMSFPPVLIPEDPTFNNFIKVFQTIPILKYMLNSLIVAFMTIVCQLVIASMAAYPLARMKFKGRNIIFLIILSTMFIPAELAMIPQYIVLVKIFHLKNNLLALLIPNVVGAFGVFMMRQAFMGVPRDIEEAAIIDGCNSFKVFYQIMLPLVKPSLTSLAIFIFIGSWNNFLFPMLILEKDAVMTLPIGVYRLNGTFVTDMRLVMAGSTIALIPIIIFYVALQKYFISGMTEGAVKG